MRAPPTLALAAAAALLGAGGIHGQNGPAVRVIPRIGLLAPDSYFYEQFINFAGDGLIEWSTGSLGRSVVAGIGIEIGEPDGAVYLRAEVLHSFRTWLTVGHSVLIPRVYFQPPTVQTVWLDVPSHLTMTSVQLVLPTRFEMLGARPYVLAGLGGKFYGFDEPTSPNEVDAILPAAGFTWGGTGGAGFRMTVRGFVLDLQVRDEVSRYWDKTQHDLVFSAGLLWTVR